MKDNFDNYIKKVLKQIHPEESISKDALHQVNGFINLLIDKMISEIHKMQKMKSKTKPKKTIIGPRDVQSATKIVFKEELSRHAVSLGTQAVERYKNTSSGSKTNPKSQTERAKLVFPPSKFKNLLKEKGNKVSDLAGVYFAATIEYMISEILELSGNAARDNRKSRINDRHLFLANNNDEELLLVSNEIGFHWKGGVLPNIHYKLLKKK